MGLLSCFFPQSDEDEKIIKRLFMGEIALDGREKTSQEHPRL